MWSWRKELHVQCPFLSLSSCLLRQILSQNVWLVFFQIGWKPHWLSFFHYKYVGECVQIWVCVVWGSAWVYVCGVSVYICECVWCGGVLLLCFFIFHLSFVSVSLIRHLLVWLSWGLFFPPCVWQSWRSHWAFYSWELTLSTTESRGNRSTIRKMRKYT